DEVNYVQRLMIPDQYGTPLADSKNQDAVFDFDFSVATDWLIENCELVAFVQDTVTREIFQANTFLLSDATMAYYDVGLESIDFPGETFCGNTIIPVVAIKNLCFQSLDSCQITYTINGDIHNYTWNGELAQEETMEIELPEVSINLMGENTITVEVGSPNGHPDANPDNDFLEKDFSDAQTIGSDLLLLELHTDNKGYETSCEVTNSAGEIIFSAGNFDNNSFYTFEIEFDNNDCYRLTVFDEGGDGMCCDYGDGYYQLKDIWGTTYFSGGEFGSQETAMFYLDVATSTEEITSSQAVRVFPIPGQRVVQIQSDNTIYTLRIYNHTGQVIYSKDLNSTSFTLNTHRYKSGLYIFVIETEQGMVVKRCIIN
nr:T9SS type A sorting domain-containing protein [Bacteroidota bacterium]